MSSVALADVDWPVVIQIASRHLVACHIGCRLLESGGHGLPDEVHQYFSTIVAHNRERNARALDQALEIVGRFNAQGHESCLLKGMANLVDDLYPDLGARIIGDIDLLVGAESTDSCTGIMCSLGYGRSDPWNFRRLNPGHHHGAPWLHPDRGLSVELHHAVLARPYDALLDREQAFSASNSVRFLGETARVMPATYRMLHLIAHTQLTNGRSKKCSFELRSLVDGLVLREAYDDEIDWDLVRRVFAGNRFEYALNHFLVALHETLGVEFPAPCKKRTRDNWHWAIAQSSIERPRLWKAFDCARRSLQLLNPYWYQRQWHRLKARPRRAVKESAG